MNNSLFPKIIIFFSLVLLIGLGALIYTVAQFPPATPPADTNTNINPGGLTPASLELKQFRSAQEFKDYLDEASGLMVSSGFSGGIRRDAMLEERSVGMDAGIQFGAPTGLGSEEAANAPDRISTTNVQVAGIDEPDSLKTDGKNIFYSPTSRYYYLDAMPRQMMPLGDEVTSILPPQPSQPALKVVKAFPPAELAELGSIDELGNLLLFGNRLVVFAADRILGYDVADPAKPSKAWTLRFDDRHTLAAARLASGKLYVVTQAYVSRNAPCPLTPFAESPGAKLEVRCADIYHPIEPTPTDVTYTAMVINAADGVVSDTVSFVGSSASSVVYLSSTALYATYGFQTDQLSFVYNFFRAEMADLVPADVLQRLEKLNGYDISSRSKLAELEVIMEDFYNSLSADDQLRIQNESSNRLERYLDVHQRELERTGIVKIRLADFELAATGNVAGTPLNQFALDEHNGSLRVATTFGSTWLLGSRPSSASDVTILDSNLEQTGTIQNLGKGERIYAVRFVQDKGYVVTFRQTDPFYVLDLSDPRRPELKGELKIPGFSSYLHPISKDRILGVGQEEGKVKLSLFDVSNPSEPTEASKYLLDEYWSAVLETHHAFLLDDKHHVFFMPGSQGGYVFGYADDQLSLKKAVSDIQAQRALYLDDYLYIIGDDKIVVLNENDWERVNELEFE